MIQSPLREEFPLNPIEEEMIMTKDLLKIMLGQGQNSQEFAACLAEMCVDNEDLSRKICLVFVQSIGGATQVESTKNYLNVLNPFLMTQDSLKAKRIEWIFGYPQVTGRKGYADDYYKFGVEMINTINDDVRTYPSPLSVKLNEEVLLSICRKSQETLAVTVLAYVLQKMEEDEDILKYVFNCPAPNYQWHRYTDWIESYLVGQKQMIEKDSVP